MLLELNIRSFALIDYLAIEFGGGLNVLTGETGAGKSIVVDALTLALGGRADKDMIRTGETRAVVQALFCVSDNPGALSALAEMGVEPEDGCACLTREMGSRNLCRVNGAVTPLASFRRLAATLAELHGQHESQSLLSAPNHMRVLDAYGGETHGLILTETARKYAEYALAQKSLDDMNKSLAERERRIDVLTREIEEIAALRIKPGEDEALEKRFNLLGNAEKIASNAEKAYKYVYQGGERSLSAQELLQKAAAAMGALSGIDERFSQMAQKLDELFYQAQDAGYELRDMLDQLDFNPAQFDKIAARLDTLTKIKRKFGPTLADVLSYLDNAKQELAALSDADAAVEQLTRTRDARKQALAEACGKLGAARRALSAAFEPAVLAQLRDLGMEKARFSALCRASEGKLSANGSDDMEFLFSANPGEPLKPLASTASGGELSRVMLALKAVMADREDTGCMVFDEIDTGVSGRMAQVVGEKLAAIGARRQVIAVSHLPQIAALADRQFVVEKTVREGRTGSSVRVLTDEGRADAIAAMIGGAEDASSARAHAQSLLEGAKSWKARALNR